MVMIIFSLFFFLSFSSLSGKRMLLFLGMIFLLILFLSNPLSLLPPFWPTGATFTWKKEANAQKGLTHFPRKRYKSFSCRTSFGVDLGNMLSSCCCLWNFWLFVVFFFVDGWISGDEDRWDGLVGGLSIPNNELWALFSWRRVLGKGGIGFGL